MYYCNLNLRLNHIEYCVPEQANYELNSFKLFFYRNICEKELGCTVVIVRRLFKIECW
jgi:hypothetical protein